MKPPKNPSAQIAALIAKFDPRMAKLIQSTRAALQRRFPTAPPDPHGLLQGSGSQNRFIRLDGPATLAKPEVRELIEAAVARAKTPLPASGSGSTIIRSISARQRPRR